MEWDKKADVFILFDWYKENNLLWVPTFQLFKTTKIVIRSMTLGVECECEKK